MTMSWVWYNDATGEIIERDLMHELLEDSTDRGRWSYRRQGDVIAELYEDPVTTRVSQCGVFVLTWM